MLETLRRIVTATEEDGRSVIAVEGPPLTVLEAGGHALGEIWACDHLPPDVAGAAVDRTTEERLTLEPAPGGVKFRYVVVPPEGDVSTTTDAARQELMASAFAMIGAAHCHIKGSRHAAMHKTDTLDFIIVVKGRVTLVLDEGEAELGPGDTVVQRGTAHAWVNKGREPALLCAVLISAA